jgi:hypothetical protein
MSRSGPSSDRTGNPLIALLSQPGGGKSRFLDEAVSLTFLDSWAEKESKYEESNAKEFVCRLREAIKVTVTFNGGTHIHPEESDKGKVLAVFALRVVHS